MIEQAKEHIKFIANLKAPQRDNPLWTNRLKEEGLGRFKSLGFPSPKDEEWKYTAISPAISRNYSFPKESDVQDLKRLESYWDPSDINIVFINGFFAPEFSRLDGLPRGVVICNLTEAFKRDYPELKSYFTEYDTKGDEVFISLNNAFLNDGVFVRIEKDINLNNLIHIIHVTSGVTNDIIAMPRSLIFVGQSSNTIILESYISDTNLKYCINALTDIFLLPNSHLSYCKAQEESLEAFHFGTTRIRQERNSTIDSFSLLTGSLLTRNNLSVQLKGEGTQTILNGLYAITGKQHVDNHTTIDHSFPNSKSQQLYKGILHDQARAVFNGKILVRKEAQLTNACQLNKNLLLSKRCQVDTKPQLEISADDVKCSHGAAIGQLDQDELFYLQSRSISKDQAIKMLSRGFVEDVLKNITNIAVRSKIEKLLTRIFTVIV